MSVLQQYSDDELRQVFEGLKSFLKLPTDPSYVNRELKSKHRGKSQTYKDLIFVILTMEIPLSHAPRLAAKYEVRGANLFAYSRSLTFFAYSRRLTG